ncbi:MAG: YdbH domain-containing protein [Kiloniellales bacterium]
MTRKFGLVLILGLGLLVTALAGLVVFRTVVAETLIEAALRARGIPAPRLTVAAIDLAGAHVTELRLGAQDELSVASLRISYTPLDLLRGEVEHIAAEGLSLKLDLTGAAPLLGSLTPLIPDQAGQPDEPGEGAAVVPPLTLTNGRIDAATPLGAITLLVGGEARPGERGMTESGLSYELEGALGRLGGRLEVSLGPDRAIEGRFTVAGGAFALPEAEGTGLSGALAFTLREGLPTKLDGEFAAARLVLGAIDLKAVRLTLETSGPDMIAGASLRAADDLWSADLHARLDDVLAEPGTKPRVLLELQAQADAGASLWTLLGGPGPSRGRTVVNLAAQGEIPPLRDLIESSDGPNALWSSPGSAFTGHLSLDLSDIDSDDRFDRLSGTLRILGRYENQNLELTLAEEARLEARRVNTSWLEALGVPPDLAADFRDGGGLVFAAGGAHPTRARLNRTPPDPTLFLSTEVRLAAAKGAELTVACAARIRLSDDLRPIDVSFDHIGIAARDLPLAGVRVSALQLSGSGRVTLSRDRDGGISYDHDLRLETGVGQITLSAAGTPPLGLEITLGSVRVAGGATPDTPYWAKAEFAGARLALPDYGLAATRITAKVDLLGGQEFALIEFGAGALEHAAATPLFAPLSLQGRIRVRNKSLDFTAEARGPKGTGRLTLAGKHERLEGRGELRATLEPLAFTPSGPGPGALLPPLGDLKSVSGEVAAVVRLSWDADGIAGQAELSLRDVSFVSAEGKVEGLDLDLRLDRLFPPGSPGGQSLSVRRLDPGLPLENLALRFRVAPGDPPHLVIEHGGLGLIGGRVSLRDAVIDPGGGRQDITLRIEALDLAELFRILGVAGLSGTGRLSGTIPLRLGRDHVAIEQGRLEAAGPGVLRFRSKEAAQVLAGAGESAALLLRALENFHYHDLALTIDKSAGGEARLGLALSGNNPDVLDGYPFRLNIGLEADPGRLVKALSQVYSLSDNLLSRARIFGN